MPPELSQPQMPPQMPAMPPAPPSPESVPGVPAQPEEEMAQVPEMEEDFPSYNPSPVGDGRPYFMGDYALIKFAGGEEGMGPETFWLVDRGNQTIRPFESEMALDAAFGEDLPAALQNLVVIEPPLVDEEGEIQEGILTGFTLLGPEFAILEDGTSKPLDFSNHQLRNRYGKQINEDLEDLGAQVIEGFLDLLSTNENKTNISKAFINKLKNDQRLMAFYISAMAYGDYTLEDIYADISNRFHSEN